MTTLPPVSILDRLADEILQHILDFAMARGSPFYMDNPYPRVNNIGLFITHPVLGSSTVTKDPLLTNTGPHSNTTLHQRAPQSVHRADWIIINHTNRRIRRLGKQSYFRAKTIAMEAELLAQLQRNDFKRMMPNDQALALSCIRDIVIIESKEQQPTWYLGLPQLLAALPCLRRCTLLFGTKTASNDPEWVTAAVALGAPVLPELQELMTKVGLPENLILEEAIGPTHTWAKHRDNMERFIYTHLRMKAKILEAKRQKEEERRGT